MPERSDLEDPDAEEWEPDVGPEDWERGLQATDLAWRDEENDHHRGIAIRYEGDPDQWIASDLYTPDLRGMA